MNNHKTNNNKLANLVNIYVRLCGSLKESNSNSSAI